MSRGFRTFSSSFSSFRSISFCSSNGSIHGWQRGGFRQGKGWVMKRGLNTKKEDGWLWREEGEELDQEVQNFHEEIQKDPIGKLKEEFLRFSTPQIRSTHGSLLSQLVSNHFENGKFKECLDMTDMFLRMNPKDPFTGSLRFIRGKVFLVKGEYAKAAAEFSHAVNTTPMDAILLRGFCFLLLNYTETAMINFQTSKLFPSPHRLAFLLSSFCLVLKKKWKVAEAQLSAAAENELKGRMDVVKISYVLRAHCYLHMKKNDSALKMINTAMQLPNNIYHGEIESVLELMQTDSSPKDTATLIMKAILSDLKEDYHIALDETVLPTFHNKSKKQKNKKKLKKKT